MKTLILKGHVVFTPTSKNFEIHENSYLIVEDGVVKGIFKKLPEQYKNQEVKDFTDKLIIPGFVDLHLHAPQYVNRGLGMDKELLPWLETYTFPEESKFRDINYAKRVYKKLIEDLWKYGTTSAVIFSSVHKDSTKLLMDLFINSGMRAYIGKVNMDRNVPDELKEDTEKSLEDTEEIILEYKDKSPLVKPIITPRFVPTCSEKLMQGLGELALKYNIPVQSHLNENVSEVKWVSELHPDFPNYASVYDRYNLFGQTKTVMAHCIYNTDEEIDLMAKNQVYAAHSVHSNFNLSSGIMPVRKFLERNVPVGLGSDISGGHTLSIPQVMVAAIQASKMKWLESDKKLMPLTIAEAFYLATKGGGSFFGKVGSFEEGYDLDCLIIDDSTINNSDIRELSVEERVQRFIYLGDDRNIIERYVKGEKIDRPQ
ncbi:guanine deaminase [Caldanaerobacter subterraneus]|uniref:Guanine deaminase n=1 Tax=Caldanaerobacter subterraneus TaxID=911092 RepID=A0A7Y2PLS4_9THEO|nr:guanine deaminase [Caldanaerobacter subterraneus]NNG65906.1 guanine deaminase [Caldanaerobacter subterraneus]